MHKYLTTLGALKWPGTNVDLIEMLLQPAFKRIFLNNKSEFFNTSSLEVSISRFTIVFESKYMLLLLYTLSNHNTGEMRRQFYSYLVTLVTFETFSWLILILCFLLTTHFNFVSLKDFKQGSKRSKKKFSVYQIWQLGQSRRNIVLFPIRRPYVTSNCCHLSTNQTTTNFIENKLK